MRIYIYKEFRFCQGRGVCVGGGANMCYWLKDKRLRKRLGPTGIAYRVDGKKLG